MSTTSAIYHMCILLPSMCLLIHFATHILFYLQNILHLNTAVVVVNFYCLSDDWSYENIVKLKTRGYAMARLAFQL